MSITGGYKHKDLPVAINGNFMKRVQSISFNKNVPILIDYEMGNEEPAGASEDTNTFGGSLSWNPIDNAVEASMMGLPDITAADPRGLLHFSAMEGVPIRTVKEQINGAKLVTLTYSLRVGGVFSATMSFDGTGYTTGSSVTPINPTGVGAYRAPSLIVTVGGVQAARAQGFDIRAGFRVDRLMELSSSTPVAIDRDTPQVSIGVDWVESDSIAGNTEITLASPADIVVSVGTASGGKRLTVTNCVFTGYGAQGNIGGYATKRYEYVSKSDSTYGGLKIDKIT